MTSRHGLLPAADGGIRFPSAPHIQPAAHGGEDQGAGLGGSAGKLFAILRRQSGRKLVHVTGDGFRLKNFDREGLPRILRQKACVPQFGVAVVGYRMGRMTPVGRILRGEGQAVRQGDEGLLVRGCWELLLAVGLRPYRDPVVPAKQAVECEIDVAALRGELENQPTGACDAGPGRKGNRPDLSLFGIGLLEDMLAAKPDDQQRLFVLANSNEAGWFAPAMLDAQIAQFKIQGQEIFCAHKAKEGAFVRRVVRRPEAGRRSGQREQGYVESDEVAPRKAAQAIRHEQILLAYGCWLVIRQEEPPSVFEDTNLQAALPGCLLRMLGDDNTVRHCLKKERHAYKAH